MENLKHLLREAESAVESMEHAQRSRLEALVSVASQVCKEHVRSWFGYI